MNLDSENLSLLKSGLNPRGEIISLIKQYAPSLAIPFGEDAKSFLYALCGVESSFGENSVLRYEYAYGPGGIYYSRSKELKFQYSKYGALASCSYGPWQILFINTLQLGYQGHPLSLWDGAISLPFVIKYLNQAKGNGANSIELLAASYNGGLGAIKNQNDQVKSYVAKILKIYNNSKGTIN